MEVDIHEEQNNIKNAAITALLNLFIGPLGFILSLYFLNKAANGLKEKLEYAAPKEQVSKSIKSFIIGTILYVGGIIAIALGYPGVFSDASSAQVTNVALVYLGGISVIAGAILFILSTYWWIDTFAKIGEKFKIEDFHTAKTVFFILLFGMPLWVLLSIIIIGAIIILILEIVMYVKLLTGAGHVPTIVKDSSDEPATSLTMPVY